MEKKSVKNAEQIRLDAIPLKIFREKLFALVKEGMVENSVTFNDAMIHARELQTLEEFKDVKSIQNLEMSELWWEKYKEKYREELEPPVVEFRESIYAEKDPDDESISNLVNAEDPVADGPIEMEVDEPEEDSAEEYGEQTCDDPDVQKFEQRVLNMVQSRLLQDRVNDDKELVYAARALRSQFNEKSVNDLKMTPAWWRNFKKRFGITTQKSTEPETSEATMEIELENDGVENVQDDEIENSKKNDKIETSPETRSRVLDLIDEQKLEIYQFKVANPNKTFFEIAKVFSEKFKTRV